MDYTLRHVHDPGVTVEVLGDGCNGGASTMMSEHRILVVGSKPRQGPDEAQTVQLPEYVPLLFLRDPPGDASYTELARGKTYKYVLATTWFGCSVRLTNMLVAEHR